MDMLGGFGAAPAAPAAGGMDMFGGMAGGMGSPALVDVPQSGGPGTEWQGGCLDQMSMADLGRFPVAPQQKEQLAFDETMHISYQKFRKDDELVVVLYLFNRTPQAMQSITTLVDPPESCAAAYGGYPQPMSAGGKVTTTGAQPMQAANVQIKLRLQDTLSLGFSVVAKVQYQNAQMQNKFLNVSIPLELSDYLRPTPGVAVAQFGQAWGGPGMVERKVSVPGSIVRDANTFMQRAGAGLNIFPIQAIGTEAVCIGKTINNTMVLLHGKTGPAALDVLIRTPSKELSEAIGSAIRNEPTFK